MNLQTISLQTSLTGFDKENNKWWPTKNFRGTNMNDKQPLIHARKLFVKSVYHTLEEWINSSHLYVVVC